MAKDKKLLKDLNTFEVVYLAGLVIGSMIRNVYAAKSRVIKTAKNCSNVLDIVLVLIAGAGMVVPLLYLFTPWLDFANYNLPGWCGYIGTVIFAGAIFMLWRSHADLGLNWAARLRITSQHSLVTSGVYRRIRHPLYTAHLLWAIAQGLLLSNWLAGWAFLVLLVPLYLVRIPKEEQMMLEHFGEEYLAYKSRTGRLVPRM